MCLENIELVFLNNLFLTIAFEEWTRQCSPIYLRLIINIFFSIDRIEIIQGNEIFKIIKEDKYKLAIKKKLDFEVQSAYHLKLRYGYLKI